MSTFSLVRSVQYQCRNDITKSRCC